MCRQGVRCKLNLETGGHGSCRICAGTIYWGQECLTQDGPDGTLKFAHVTADECIADLLRRFEDLETYVGDLAQRK